jgi:hypothetical protein
MPKDKTAPQDTGQDETGYEANVNQVRHEPIRVSRHDERGQAAAGPDEEDGEDASPSRPREAESGQPDEGNGAGE